MAGRFIDRVQKHEQKDIQDSIDGKSWHGLAWQGGACGPYLPAGFKAGTGMVGLDKDFHSEDSTRNNQQKKMV